MGSCGTIEPIPVDLRKILEWKGTWLKMALGKSLPVLVFRTETLVRSHVLTFASSAHAIIIVVNGINAKNAFVSANERS